MTLNEILMESAFYSLIGTIVAISLGYILYRQDKADRDDKQYTNI